MKLRTIRTQLSFLAICVALTSMMLFGACAFSAPERSSMTKTTQNHPSGSTSTYRGFRTDGVLESKYGTVHYCYKIPDSYDKNHPYALFVTLPGWEGLYFQGVAENLKAEEFAFGAGDYVEDLIVIAPQLDDWGETSANMTLALIDSFLTRYNIDEDRIFLNGYSGGGETLSLVMEKRPALFARVLHVSSQWDGNLTAVADAKTPVYFFIGEDDSYYGSGPTLEAYERLTEAYRQEGLSREEIDQLVVLDVKDAAWFRERNVPDQHGGGLLAAEDKHVMSWLFHV